MFVCVCVCLFRIKLKGGSAVVQLQQSSLPLDWDYELPVAQFAIKLYPVF